jgi:hypothetical protein
MSGPDDADRDKGFLARWSQRKQEAKQPEPKPDAPTDENTESSGSPAPQGDDVTPEFDLSTLPKLEELTGRISAQGRTRAFAECGFAKILGAGPCDS